MTISHRYQLPRQVVRGTAVKAALELREGGSLVALDSNGTYTLKKGSSTALSYVATSTGTTESATASLLAADLTDLALGVDYLEEWAVRVSGQDYVFRREVYIVRRELHPTLSDADLLRLHSDLGHLRPSNLESYEPYRLAAWGMLINRLIGKGNYPQLIINAQALFNPHLWLTLHLVAQDFGTAEAGPNGKWQNLAPLYWERYGDSFDEMQLEYDSNEDGAADSDRHPAVPVIYLTSNKRQRWLRPFGGY